MLWTTCRLSFKLRASRRSNRTRRVPTIIVVSGQLSVASCQWESPLLFISNNWPLATDNWPLLQGSLHLLDAEGLDNVADLDVVVAGNFQAALEALADLGDIVLDAFERVQAGTAVRRWVNHDAFANEPDLGVAANDALSHEAAGHRADATDLEGLADHGSPQIDHFLDRLELAFQSGADVVGQVVNDVVLANLHAFVLGQCAGAVVGNRVKANDQRVLRGSQGQPDVVFGDGADGGLQEAYAHFL